MSKVEELKTAIQKHKDYMAIQEMSNDGYYISRQYKEDKQHLYELEQALKKENEHERI